MTVQQKKLKIKADLEKLDKELIRNDLRLSAQINAFILISLN